MLVKVYVSVIQMLGSSEVEQLTDIRDDINRVQITYGNRLALSILYGNSHMIKSKFELFGKEGVSTEWVSNNQFEAGG